jgi:hypothetical protein
MVRSELDISARGDAREGRGAWAVGSAPWTQTPSTGSSLDAAPRTRPETLPPATTEGEIESFREGERERPTLSTRYSRGACRVPLRQLSPN